MGNGSERRDRLEDALVDLATLMTEGGIARPALLVGWEGTEASKRLLNFVQSVRVERESQDPAAAAAPERLRGST